MTLAAARLAYLAKKNPPHLDRFARILADTIDEQHGILFLARISQALAILQDFNGRTLQDLQRFNEEKQIRLERTIREFGDAAPTAPLHLTDIRLVTGTTPYAFAIHEPDDSYGIGFDEALYDIFTIFTISALAAFRNRDLEIYKHFCLHAFQLYFMGPHPSIIADFEELAMMYAGSASPIRSMIGDVRDMCTRFVLAHEAAHIALCHFERHEAAVFNFQPGVQPTEISGFPHHACEFEADAWAADLLLRLAGGNMRAEMAAIQTPPLLMTFLAHIGTLGEGMAILSDKLRACHPPEEERRANLRATAERNSRERPRQPDLVLQIGDFLAQLDSPLNAAARASLRASLQKPV